MAHLASFPGEGFAERVLRSERWAERLGAQPVMGLLAESIHDKLQKLLYGDSSAPEPVGVLRGSSPVATFVDEKHSWSKEQADRFYDGFGKPTSSP